MEKEIICVICPKGCRIKVAGEDGQIHKIENYGCKRGVEYASSEFVSPCRILTSSIPVEGTKDKRMLPIRSSSPIPRDKLLHCMEQIKKTKINNAVVQMHQPVIKNILGTGIDMIACRTMR
jgi:CxxC motif-containing protein